MEKIQENGNKKTLLYLLMFIPVYIHAGREVDHIETLVGGHFTTSYKDTQGYAKWCKLFNPTKEQLIDYFAKAEEADFSGEWFHEYYSPCVTSGTVTFKDGSYGTWGLHSTGLGGVTFQDKENYGKKKSFLYLDNTWDNE